MCGVEILDQTDTCPLCNHVLDGDASKGRKLYPDARIVTRKYQFLENIFLFASIVLWCILFAVDYFTDPEFLWSFTAGLVIIYANILLRLTILGKSSYMTKIIWTILIALAFLIEADFLTGYHGWGVNFAFPTAKYDRITLHSHQHLVLSITESQFSVCACPYSFNLRFPNDC